MNNIWVGDLLKQDLREGDDAPNRGQQLVRDRGGDLLDHLLLLWDSLQLIQLGQVNKFENPKGLLPILKQGYARYAVGYNRGICSVNAHLLLLVVELCILHDVLQTYEWSVFVRLMLQKRPVYQVEGYDLFAALTAHQFFKLLVRK